MGLFGRRKMVTADRALPGRPTPLPVTGRHVITGQRIAPPFPAGLATAVFGMGCFWGAERLFWQLPGVWSTAVGYAGGFTENPTYEETCSGRTGHAEVVLVVFDPARIGYADLLRTFWEGHDPTQGMRQGNDRGTQYRSAVYTIDDDQRTLAEAAAASYADALTAARRGAVTTEIAPLGTFFHAEDHHQQYLAKNPGGHCGIGGTGVACPVLA
ncbi:peptide-methionine (S)-S-oxide reductase MsrA [Pseudonocardia abyssalis]|jgi:peptide-methionine (S)-S-oxide reductase|uniref:Peptide methionine sulfoxide reductase MsrA n=1 Tax=Pseudonocardia abyssalis TaxID=2792008 RepID=A0ABS6UY63_9PSEU|nr:peptide-methionine (S)-S-oxide reductase MsrA [Pseudonocardia abyssalis]MBW0119626.1 peptide-methionine (S)-S-oxide reductase MsrA [Pseudonocardia abyssalis]MBW0137169.1 peptide-methionine (S)-S-oxide reductase MsrA [Pseudonocardia abyssalis]